jgi:hypothetical protein
LLLKNNTADQACPNSPSICFTNEITLAILLFSIALNAQNAYRPQTQASGTIRSWCSAQMAELMAPGAPTRDLKSG